MHSIPLAGKRVCFVVISNYLMLTIFLISLGNSSISSHPNYIKVFKFCWAQMESSNFFILLFPCKLRYLKCFKVLIELDNVSNVEYRKFRNRRCLNLEMHVSTKDSLIVIAMLLIPFQNQFLFVQWNGIFWYRPISAYHFKMFRV